MLHAYHAEEYFIYISVKCVFLHFEKILIYEKDN